MATTAKPETTTAERVDELVREGMSKTDAYAKVAEERTLAVSSVRGAYYPANKQNGAKTTKPLADPIEAARAVLQAALDQIAAEVEQAEEVLKTAGERKALLEQKINALA